MKNLWIKIKCFFGFHEEGRFIKETRPFINFRFWYECKNCKKEYYIKGHGAKPWGG